MAMAAAIIAAQAAPDVGTGGLVAELEPRPDFSFWTVEDDLRLKHAMENGAAMEALARGAIRFSRRFSIKELRARWRALLYDPVIAPQAASRMVAAQTCSPDIKRGFESGLPRPTNEERNHSDKQSNVDQINLRSIYYNSKLKRKYMSVGKPSQKVMDQYDFSLQQQSHKHDIPDEIDLEVKKLKSIHGRSNRKNLSNDIKDLAAEDIFFDSQKSYKSSGRNASETIQHISGLHNSMSEYDFMSRGNYIDYVNTCNSDENDDVNYEGDDDNGFDKMIGLLASDSTNDLFEINHEIELPHLTESISKPISKPPSEVHSSGNGLLHIVDKKSDEATVGKKELNNCFEKWKDTQAIKRETLKSHSIPQSKDIGKLAKDERDKESTYRNESFIDDKTGNTISASLQMNEKKEERGEEQEISLVPKTINQGDEAQELGDDCLKNGHIKSLQDNLGRSIEGKNSTIPTSPNFNSSSNGTSILTPTNPSPAEILKESSVLSQQMNNNFLSEVKFNDVSELNRLNVDSDGSCMNNLYMDKFTNHVIFSKSYSRGGILDDTFDNDDHYDDLGDKKSNADDESYNDMDDDFDEEDIPSFSDVESLILDLDLDPGDYSRVSARKESFRLFMRQKKTILRLEKFTFHMNQKFLTKKSSLAILYGKHRMFYIKKAEVCLGRSTIDNSVDIDISFEGKSNKVSRKQALIALKEDGVFYLKNIGRKPITINKTLVQNGQRAILGNLCLIEVGGIRLLFEINFKLVREWLAKYVGNVDEFLR